MTPGRSIGIYKFYVGEHRTHMGDSDAFTNHRLDAKHCDGAHCKQGSGTELLK